MNEYLRKNEMSFLFKISCAVRNIYYLNMARLAETCRKLH
jgi:hypothetical protein